MARSPEHLRALIILGAPLLLLATGCASAADRQAAELSSSLQRVQAEQDRAFEDVKAEQPAPPPRAPEKRGEPKPLLLTMPEEGIPDLPSSDDPDDQTPRPTIRVAGVPFRKEVRGKSVIRGNDRVESSGADEQPEAPRKEVSALDPEAKRVYERALGLVQSKKYPEAVEALSAFMARYPDHPYIENAIYWKGEAFFAQGDFTRAAAEFDGIATRPILGVKTADALLKLGMSQDRLGQAEKSRASFDRLLREFPRSEAARRIPSSPSGKGPK